MNAMPALRAGAMRHEVIGGDDARWQRLHALIEARSLMRGDFILSSGRTSKFLFQLRQTTMAPEGQFLIGQIIEEFMHRIGVGAIGGLELGAVPVVAAVAHASFIAGRPVDAFFVRKKAKQHGACELIDGSIPERAEVLIIDDVTTTAGSILKAIDAVRAERGCSVKWALSIVDRDEGGAQALAERGVALSSIFTKGDFGL